MERWCTALVWGLMLSTSTAPPVSNGGHCLLAGFELAVVAGCLTLVGGEETRRETKRTIPTNSLYVFLQPR